MGKSKKRTTKKKKRRPKKGGEGGEGGEGGGMMMGMRSGFKKTAKAVAGKSEKKSGWLDLFLNILLLGAVVFLLYRFFFQH